MRGFFALISKFKGGVLTLMPEFPCGGSHFEGPGVWFPSQLLLVGSGILIILSRHFQRWQSGSSTKGGGGSTQYHSSHRTGQW